MSGAGREHDRFVMMYHGTLTRIYGLEIAIEASRMADREMPGDARPVVVILLATNVS